MRTRLTALVLSALLLSSSAAAQEESYTIGILSWQQASYTLQAIKAFQDTFNLSPAAHTYKLGEVGGDLAKALEILQQWRQEKVNLIFTVGIEPSLLAVNELQDSPVVSIAAFPPPPPEADDSPDPPARNATGTSTWVDMTVRLRLFRECLPDLEVLGVVYDLNDPIATAEVAEAREKVDGVGLTLQEAPITEAGEIGPAVEMLIHNGVDALWVPTDTLVCANLLRVGRIAEPSKLPVLTSAPEGMSPAGSEAVALLAVAADYGLLGQLSAHAALDILMAGKSPAEVPVYRASAPVVTVNAEVAKAIGYEVPPGFMARAHKVHRGYDGQVVTIAGTGDSQDLVRALADALLSTTGSGRIEVPENIGSAGGIRALLAGKTDLARVARELTRQEADAGLTCLTFAKAPIAFVVHRSVTGIDNISSQDIVGVYSGKITRWEHLNAKQGRIYAVTREPGNPCLRVLQAQLPGFADIAEPQAKVLYSTAEARDALVGHRNTFGFLATSAAAGTDLRILSVDGVYPSAESVRSGAYKLVVPLSIVYRDPPIGLARRFTDSLFGKEAREIIAAAGAVPVDRAND